MSQTDLSVQLDTQVERLLDRSDKDGVSLALVIQQSGNVIVERYGTQPENVFQPEIEITADSTLTSWSMAKSITHAWRSRGTDLRTAAGALGGTSSRNFLGKCWKPT